MDIDSLAGALRRVSKLGHSLRRLLGLWTIILFHILVPFFSGWLRPRTQIGLDIFERISIILNVALAILVLAVAETVGVADTIILIQLLGGRLLAPSSVAASPTFVEW